MIVVSAITLKGALTLLAKRQVGYTVAHVGTDLRLDLLRALLTARRPLYEQAELSVDTSSLPVETAVETITAKFSDTD